MVNQNLVVDLNGKNQKNKISNFKLIILLNAQSGIRTHEP